MALALNNLKRVDMPLNKETKPPVQPMIVVTERTPPHPQIGWLINDSREIIKENSFFFFFLSPYFISYPILFIYLLNSRPEVL